jgi:hypothetical protein
MVALVIGVVPTMAAASPGTVTALAGVVAGRVVTAVVGVWFALALVAVWLVLAPQPAKPRAASEARMHTHRVTVALGIVPDLVGSPATFAGFDNQG